MPKHCLIKDDDGHWYVIPADKKAEAAAYFEAVYAFWDPRRDDDGSEPPDEPAWLDPVGGAPSLVTFTEDGYKIR